MNFKGISFFLGLFCFSNNSFISATFSFSQFFCAVPPISLFIFGDFIISLFLNSNDVDVGLVAFYAGIFLFVGCFFHIADSAQILFAALLRGFSDTKKPFVISFFSYWV